MGILPQNQQKGESGNPQADSLKVSLAPSNDCISLRTSCSLIIQFGSAKQFISVCCGLQYYSEVCVNSVCEMLSEHHLFLLHQYSDISALSN